MTTLSFVSGFTDSELLARATTLATRERLTTADLVATLAELDVRRLYLGVGCSSLFTYCTQVLHLSEHAAYGRIEAARAAHRFPAILAHLADGSLTLTGVCLLAPVTHRHAVQKGKRPHGIPSLYIRQECALHSSKQPT